ncbi:Protein ced-11 [Toxocara canis]|uniref:Protein ced-11 n=1 Tax=Toxocara canis TaxID=6265 RepID=A0A0B2UU34_TOXCA|nr:Protein ced-11 [Toxocara canis]
MDNECLRAANAVFSETISIIVESAWDNEASNCVQMCPALLLASQKAIPSAVKHIYSRIAAYASHIDEGIPDLILSLIATGNSFDLQCRQRVEKALSRLVAACNVWMVTTGEACDPLARITSDILRSILPTRESNLETLVIAINDVNAVANDPNVCKRMVDMRYNTLCMLWMNAEASPADMALFRAVTAIRLATPPPALLIGVADGSTGTGASTQTVLLPPPGVEQHPIPVAFFCGGDLSSLLELRTYLQSGIPVLVLQDSSELCAILSSSWLLYRSSAFEHDKWIEWLDAEIRSVAQSGQVVSAEVIAEAKENIAASLAAASGDVTLLAFISSEQLEFLCERVLHLCMHSSLDAIDVRRVMQLSVRLGEPSIVASLDLAQFCSKQCRQRVEKALSRLVAACNVWMVTTGEACDPLARITSDILRSILPTRESNLETLVIAINDVNAVANDPNVCKRMVDMRYNTLCMLWMNAEASPADMALFRAVTAIRLATPPPALLIGVADGSTGTGASTQTVLLPPPGVEQHPIPVAFFCGGDLSSLLELRTYLQSGIPVLVLQDSSELCAILSSSWLLYRSSAFEHDKWIEWLDAEIRSVAQSGQVVSAEVIAEAKENIAASLAAASGDVTLLAFISSEQLEFLCERVLHLCMHSSLDAIDVRRVMQLSVRLGEPSIVASLDLAQFCSKQDAAQLYEEALLADERIPVLSVLLDQRVPFTVTLELLRKMLNASPDQYFFNNVIVCQCLGRRCAPSEIDIHLISELNKLLRWLSGGINDLLPPQYFEVPMPDETRSFGILATWAVLLNRGELAKCLCAYSQETLPLALVLARVCRTLAEQARSWFFYENGFRNLSRWLSEHSVAVLERAHVESPQKTYRGLCIPLENFNRLTLTELALQARSWFFYENGFRNLSRWLSEHSVAVLERAHVESPQKTYRGLCIPLENFNRLTLTELALQTNNKQFIAHRCCQRWVHRLLYANLQVTSSRSILFIPEWLKIVISSFVLLPVWFWMRLRVPECASREPFRTSSPTVALLQDGRNNNKNRSHSTYSVVSARSSQRDEGVILLRDERMTGESSATPQSGALSISPTIPQQETVIVEDPPKATTMLLHKSKRSVCNRSTVPLATFYSTPIVKFWLSLVFRLAHLLIFAYSITLPGCGSLTLDTLVWVWTFIMLLESIWVFSNRLHRSPLRQLRWRLFDIIAISIQLFVLLTLKLFGQITPNDFIPIRSAFTSHVTSALFLLYLCYSTLFHYIPLSETFGPLMVRVKLIVMRDFINFLVLVALIIGSSAVAVQAILYPDHVSDFSILSKSLSWAWLSLFTTDLSGLHETDSCKKTFMGEPTDYCTAVGGYANYECPSQSPAGYFAVVEYFVVLKLICWPILFALFAKTAKEVDEIADRIWKYQLYSLVEDFRLRPVLPPPLTPIYFLGISCCRAAGCFSSFFRGSYSCGSDHPDVLSRSSKEIIRSVSAARFGNVYHNPSVPLTQTRFTHFKTKSKEIWSCSRSRTSNDQLQQCMRSLRQLKDHMRLMIVSTNFSTATAKGNLTKSKEIWSCSRSRTSNDQLQQCMRSLRQLKDHMRLMIVSTNFSTATAKDRLHSWYGSSTTLSYSPEAHINKLSVQSRYMPWNVLIADYCPPFYCKSIDEFPSELQKHVDCFTAQNANDVRRQWRQRQQTDLLNTFNISRIVVSPAGLPLNPCGRKGIAGRGDHFKFGPNYYGVFVILHGGKNEELKVLLENKALPIRWRFECGRHDEALEMILRNVLRTDSDIAILSSQCQLNVGESDSGVAHVLRRHRDDPRDTDNSWTEVDVWAIHLGTRFLDMHESAGVYSWHLEKSCVLSAQERDFVSASLKLLATS